MQFFSGPIWQSPWTWVCLLGLGVALLWDQIPGFLGLNVQTTKSAGAANPLTDFLADLRRRRRLARLSAVEYELAQLGVPDTDRVELLKPLLTRAIADQAEGG